MDCLDFWHCFSQKKIHTISHKFQAVWLKKGIQYEDERPKCPETIQELSDLCFAQFGRFCMRPPKNDVYLAKRLYQSCKYYTTAILLDQCLLQNAY